MKTLLIIIIFILTTLESHSKKDDCRNLTDGYIDIKNALVKSDSETASKKAENMIEIMNNLDFESLSDKQFNNFKKNKTQLLKIAEQIKNSNNIELQRKSFAELSLLIWDIVKNFEEINQDLFYFYCPMKKTYWISYENKVQNPYYGSKMLTCGSLSEKRLKK
jgi:hypothetical protein